MNNNKIFTALFSLVLFFLSCGIQAQPFWEESNSPQVIGERVVNHLLAQEEYMMYITDDFTGIHYAEAAVGYGAAKLMHALGNEALLEKIEQRYQVVPGTGELAEAGHVDANVWGILPLQLYLNNREEHADLFQDDLVEGLFLANAQWTNPRQDGLTRQTRFWIDDIWMVNSLQIQAYRATGESIYLQRAARQTAVYLEKLQQENGLFYHGENAPFHWGRGNGWVAAGLAELLSELPESNQYYPAILASFKKMMASLLDYQAEDGMWRQLIDQEQSWKESSSTAMFGFAMATGVNRGILARESYTAAYQKAWLALTSYVDEEGALGEVCVGTGQSLDINYYLERPRTRGDFHGQAPLLWFAQAISTGSLD